MVEQKQKERKFLEQLLDGTKVENYTIPVPIKAELRKYQQVRKHFSRENGRARGRHACLLLAHPFFLVPTTSKRLLRRLAFLQYPNVHRKKIKSFQWIENRRTITAAKIYNHGQKSWGTFAFMELFFSSYIKNTSLTPQTYVGRVCRDFFFRVSTLCKVGDGKFNKMSKKMHYFVREPRNNRNL